MACCCCRDLSSFGDPRGQLLAQFPEVFQFGLLGFKLFFPRRDLGAPVFGHMGAEIASTLGRASSRAVLSGLGGSDLLLRGEDNSALLSGLRPQIDKGLFRRVKHVQGPVNSRIGIDFLYKGAFVDGFLRRFLRLLFPASRLLCNECCSFSASRIALSVARSSA